MTILFGRNNYLDTFFFTRAPSSEPDIVDCQDNDSKVPLEYMTEETPISAVLPVAIRKLHTYDQVCSLSGCNIMVCFLPVTATYTPTT